MRLLLIVDDDRDTREVVAEILAAERFSTAEAANVSDALSKLRTLKPDLVLLDYAIPCPSDGDEFLRSKAADPQVASIPVVLMSGFKALPEMDGVVAFMPKPFGIRKLLDLIAKVLGQRDESGEAAG